MVANKRSGDYRAFLFFFRRLDDLADDDIGRSDVSRRFSKVERRRVRETNRRFPADTKFAGYGERAKFKPQRPFENPMFTVALC